MVIPAKVEEKIRYLIRKFPNTEWSGVLFIKHTGSFEMGDLTITCEDLYPMDLGTSGWTEFKMTEDVTAYMAENLELFECDLALCHSHHVLGAFFSGQDVHTLQVEGNDTNCFVSLIVDTKGTYQAAITRKLKMKRTLKISTSDMTYEFFGEGEKFISKGQDYPEETKEETVIQYFMLDIEKEEVSNPLSYLDKRFDEIEEKKAKSKKSTSSIKLDLPWEDRRNDNMSFRDWLNSPKDKEPEEQYLFDKETMKEMEVEHPINFDPSVIHSCIVKMITCSFIIDSTKFDLKQWIIRHMEKKYMEVFSVGGSFDAWAEFIIEYLIENYEDDNIAIEDFAMEEYQDMSAMVAQAMYDELFEYSGQNTYIDQYLDILMRWTA